MNPGSTALRVCPVVIVFQYHVAVNPYAILVALRADDQVMPFVEGNIVGNRDLNVGRRQIHFHHTAYLLTTTAVKPDCKLFIGKLRVGLLKQDAAIGIGCSEEELNGVITVQVNQFGVVLRLRLDMRAVGKAYPARACNLAYLPRLGIAVITDNA